MYIDFMDTLRNIQNGIYPQIKSWYVEIKDSIDKNNIIKDDILLIKDETAAIKCDTKATQLESKSWANEEVDTPVKEYYCRKECGTIVEVDKEPKVYSAKHHAAKSKEISEIERWKAMAAQMTAWSFSNEEYGTYVRTYSSNGDGTFLEEVIDGVYSARHYAKDTEKLSGQMRWIETQEALDCQKLFIFSKDINHADVYVNGIRKIDVECYDTQGTHITFHDKLNEGDVVTVSGMEAITGDYYQDKVAEIEKLTREAKLARCKAEAARKTSQSFTSEAIGQTVKIYTVDDSCNETITNTDLFSTLHWSSIITELKSGIMVLNTYDDLEHLSPSDAMTVYLRGGAEVNDGRHGMFIYDHTHTCVNNGGTVINGYVRQYTGSVDVRWFLAEGDGVTNDTKAIKQALSIKENILFPDGQYIVDEPLVFDNILVEADKVTILANIDKGRIITCQKMSYGQGIVGSLLVDWYKSKGNRDTVSYFIQGCDGATFDIGSKDAAIGVQVDPEFGNMIDNTFNLNLMKNNTVGVYVGSRFKRYMSDGNKFIGGEFTTEDMLSPSMAHVDIASFVYLDASDNTSVSFERPGFDIAGRDDDKFKMFRLKGNNTYIRPAYAHHNVKTGILGIVSGSDIVLDFSLTPKLKIYADERFEDDGFESNIDATGAENLKVIGQSNLTTIKNATYEYFSKTTKPAQTFSNEDGLAMYFPTNGDIKLIEFEDTSSSKSLFISPWSIEFQDNINGDETYIRNGSFVITDGILLSRFDKKGFTVNVKDDTLPFDEKIGFSVVKGSKTISLTTDYIELKDDTTVDKVMIGTNSIKIDDATSNYFDVDSSHFKISDKSDKAQVSATKDDITVTDGHRNTIINPAGTKIHGIKPNNLINLDADRTVIVERNEDRQNILTLKNYGRGGALLIDVPERGDSALRINANGKSITEIRSGDTWIADGKKVKWHGLTEPKTGAWEVGDMVFADEPIVLGNIGWVCVQQGRPGKWKPWGKVDIFNEQGHQWRNEEIDFYATHQQVDFIVDSGPFKRAKVYINGIKIKSSEFVVTPATTSTQVRLHTPASKDDWVSIEF